MPGQSAREAFERIVAEVLDSLPDDIASALSNVEVVVEEEPPPDLLADLPRGQTLLGHYHGVPLTQRAWYGNVLPDKISIYRGPITRSAATVEQLKDQIRKTVLHELGHHFGMDEDRLRELGWG
jgi:predicted Zn-dependent protease with MMP-like domain